LLGLGQYIQVSILTPGIGYNEDIRNNSEAHNMWEKFTEQHKKASGSKK
jgi:hypothetical protein